MPREPQRRVGRPRKVKMLNLANLMNKGQSVRHHPYNLRKTTLQRAPGTMNEHVLARIGSNLSTQSRNSGNNSSDSQAPQPQQMPSVMNTNASNLFLSEVEIQTSEAMPSAASSSGATQRAGKVKKVKSSVVGQKSRSTIILHRNPHFDADGHRRSCLLKLRNTKQSKEVAKKSSSRSSYASNKPKSAVGKHSANNKNDMKNEPQNAKDSIVDASSLAEDSAYFRENIGKLMTQLMAHCSGSEIKEEPRQGRSSKAKRKPNESAVDISTVIASDCACTCPTLAAILGSMDSFLKNVTKRPRAEEM